MDTAQGFDTPIPSAGLTSQEFLSLFLTNLQNCPWEPHPLYSVFTQYDQEYYLRQKDAFLHKYRCFYAVSKTISPRRIIELGTFAGSSGDAYLSAAPGAEYLGLDLFGEALRHDDQTSWWPYEIAERLFEARGFKHYQLERVDLRTLDKLPREAELVVVDAAHDFENEYADLRLALTANPDFIFVDDYAGEEARLAVHKFLNEDAAGRVEYTQHIEYCDQGFVIKLRR